MSLPMLADFAIRLVGGLAAVLAITPWRVVPIRFFRTQCQVILGLGVLATLATTRPPFEPVVFGMTLALAVMAFAATVGWGLGLPRLGVPVSLAIAAVAATLLLMTSGGPTDRLRALNAASRLASGLLLGSTLTAMLLGHYYLTAPSMSIDPLKRLVRLMAGSLCVRTVLSGLTLILLRAGPASGGGDRPPLPRDPVGDGDRRCRPGDPPRLADRADPLDPVGHRHPLHRHDPPALRRAEFPRARPRLTCADLMGSTVPPSSEGAGAIQRADPPATSQDRSWS